MNPFLSKSLISPKYFRVMFPTFIRRKSETIVKIVGEINFIGMTTLVAAELLQTRKAVLWRSSVKKVFLKI